ncbi:MAG: hypothetical protein ACPGRH_03460 [Alphaproteobacteria bacterium]
MIDETSLSKGHMRKLTALRKSLGNDIADKAFVEWQKVQAKAPAELRDPVAEALLEAVAPVIETLNLGRYGYTVRRSRAGLTATRNSSLQD